MAVINLGGVPFDCYQVQARLGSMARKKLLFLTVYCQKMRSAFLHIYAYVEHGPETKDSPQFLWGMAALSAAGKEIVPG
jgi:hypothetical protein